LQTGQLAVALRTTALRSSAVQLLCSGSGAGLLHSGTGADLLRPGTGFDLLCSGPDDLLRHRFDGLCHRWVFHGRLRHRRLRPGWCCLQHPGPDDRSGSADRRSAAAGRDEVISAFAELRPIRVRPASAGRTFFTRAEIIRRV